MIPASCLIYEGRPATQVQIERVREDHALIHLWCPVRSRRREASRLRGICFNFGLSRHGWSWSLSWDGYGLRLASLIARLASGLG